MKNYLWHRIIFVILRYTAGPFIKRAFGYSCGKYKGPDAPCLIISNHNSDIDPALVALGFSRHMYFLASEHAFRLGFASKILRFVFEPIPINKTRNDFSAIKEMMRRLKAGANVCLFAEGDRSFSGITGPVSISAAKLVKTSGADLVTFRIEGGYLTTPRWASNKRKGKMSGGIVGRYSAAELEGKTNEQVLDAIERDIYENAYERQVMKLNRYRGENLAEHIETVLYLCPVCNEIGTIRSEGNRFFCGCGLDAVYSDTGLLEGEGLRFSTIADWDVWQSGQLEEIIANAGDGFVCSDEDQKLFEVHAAAGRSPVGEGKMHISRNEFHCAGLSFPLGDITRFAVTGKMTLSFALKDGATYEVHSVAPRSALKYREILRILRDEER